MNKNETIADIRKEAEARFRELLEKHVDSLGHIQAMQQFNQVFDRIEAAAKRDCEDAERRGNHAATNAICETIEKVGPLYDAESVGNAAKLREAIYDALAMLERVHQVHDARIHLADIVSVGNAKSILLEALKEPPRNCDLGTAGEQERRFKEFCDAHWSINNADSECAGCPLTIEGSECEFAWEQMPYKEGENK